MLGSSAVLSATAPTLRERRGEQNLLVWGGLGQWMVVDDDVVELVTGLDGVRTLGKVLRGLTGASQSWSVGEVAPVLDELIRRGIAREDGRPTPAAASPPALLGVLTMNLTRRCNLRCMHCYAGAPQGGELPIEALLAALDGVGSVCRPGAILSLLGGEPLLVPERLSPVLVWAERAFSGRVTVSTNGTRITPAVLDLLGSHSVEVQVSLDSPDPDENDTIRGRGSFDAATRGLELLNQAGVKTLVSMVYTARSYRRFEALLDLCRRLGVTEARFMPLRRMGRARSLVDLVPDQAQVIDHVLDVLERRRDLLPLLGRDYLSTIVRRCSRTSTRSGCGVGTDTLLVDADGLVYPCPNHCSPQHCLGSLADQPLAQLYRESAALAALRELHRVERYHACRTCAFRRWCAGDCRGEVLATSGSALGPSPHCAELQRVYRRVLWLLASGDGRLAALRRAKEPPPSQPSPRTPTWRDQP